MKRSLMTTLAVGLLAVVLLPLYLSAHDVPSDVRIQMFVRPEGQTLRLLVRVPLASINDISWPELQPGMLDLSRAETALRQATSTVVDFIDVYEGGRKLEPRVVAVRASIPADRSFEVYDQALAHITAPPRPYETDVFVAQGLLDAILEYPIESDRSDFSVHPDVQQLGVQVLTVLRFLPPDRPERAFILHNDPGRIRLDPSWWQAVSIFVAEGFFHILDGIDHLLFLLCLAIPFRQFRLLFPIVTAFTIAHSITLIASVYGMAPDALWLSPLVETLIAASIVYMALENIVSPGLRRRWAIAFAFGLVHGFGFSFAMRDTLQFAGSHLVTALLSFNAGVEIGQVVVLLLLIPSLEVLFRFGVAERIGTIVLSAIVAHTGWHWLLERGSQLILYRFEWPVFDAAFFALFLQWMMIAVALAGLAWLVFGVFGLRTDPASSDAMPPASDAHV
jgi:HupE / UreJ protein